MLLIISHISQLFLPFGLKLSRPKTKSQLILQWFCYIMCVFAFFDVSLCVMKEPHFWLYHIYAPVELFFMSLVVLTLYELNDKETTNYIILSSIGGFLAFVIDFIFNDIHELDKMLMTIEGFAILLMIGGILYIHKDIDFSLKDYRTYALSGIAVYLLLNVLTYPEYHTISNIILNTFLLISLLMVNYERQTL